MSSKLVSLSSAAPSSGWRRTSAHSCRAQLAALVEDLRPDLIARDAHDERREADLGDLDLAEAELVRRSARRGGRRSAAHAGSSRSAAVRSARCRSCRRPRRAAALRSRARSAPRRCAARSGRSPCAPIGTRSRRSDAGRPIVDLCALARARERRPRAYAAQAPRRRPGPAGPPPALSGAFDRSRLERTSSGTSYISTITRRPMPSPGGVHLGEHLVAFVAILLGVEEGDREPAALVGVDEKQKPAPAPPRAAASRCLSRAAESRIALRVGALPTDLRAHTSWLPPLRRSGSSHAGYAIGARAPALRAGLTAYQSSSSSGVALAELGDDLEHRPAADVDAFVLGHRRRGHRGPGSP